MEEDFGWFGDETFLEPDGFAYDMAIAYMGDPANINSARELPDDYDQEYEDAMFELGWEQAEIEADERGWDD